MSKANKIPPFILANSRDGESEYIVHTKEPAFMVTVIVPDIPEETGSIQRTFHVKGQPVTIAISKIWGPVNDFREINKIMDRMSDWFKSYLIEKGQPGKSL